jgi:hypothetical protein
MTQDASIYFRNDKAYVCAKHRPVNSRSRIVGPPFLTAELDRGFDDLASMVTAALDASTVDVRAPDPNKLFDPILEMSGTTSFRAFLNGAKAIEVSREDTRIAVIPTRNGGPRRGFERIEAEEIAADASSLAAALKAALEKAEEWRRN